MSVDISLKGKYAVVTGGGGGMGGALGSTGGMFNSIR